MDASNIVRLHSAGVLTVFVVVVDVIVKSVFMVSFGNDCIKTDNRIDINRNKIWPCIVRRSNIDRLDGVV